MGDYLAAEAIEVYLVDTIELQPLALPPLTRLKLSRSTQLTSTTDFLFEELSGRVNLMVLPPIV